MATQPLSFKSWTTKDFVDHYRKGNGRGVTLSQIGLLEAFKRHQSVRAQTDTWIVLQRNRMRVLAQTLHGRYHTSNRPEVESRVVEDSRKSVTSTDRFWPVG